MKLERIQMMTPTEKAKSIIAEKTKGKKGRSFEVKQFSPKQQLVMNWWSPSCAASVANGIIADGSIRSGKTLSMSLSFILWAMKNFDNQLFIMAGKTIAAFRRNVLFWLFQVLEDNDFIIDERKTENKIIISTKQGVSNTFFIFGGLDERSQNLVQGLTAAGAFFDEVALMPESFVNQVLGRCSVEGSKWWFNCNPDTPAHYFYTEFIQGRREKGLIYLHFTLDDNLTLSERIKKRYRSQFSGLFYKRFIEGLWVVAEGAIYGMFDKETMTYTEPLNKNESSFFVAVDYGTINPTVYLKIYDTDDVIYVDEEYYFDSKAEQRQQDDNAYAEDLKKFIGNEYPEKVIVDPAAASFKIVLKNNGFLVTDAKNDVLNGIRVVSALFARKKIMINARCEMLIKEIQGYVWDDKSARLGIEKPIKRFDHAVDALRYYIYTMIPKYRYSPEE